MGGTHTLLSPTIIAKEALRLLKNNLVMGSIVYRDYESEFQGMPKTGGSVQIRTVVSGNPDETDKLVAKSLNGFDIHNACVPIFSACTEVPISYLDMNWFVGKVHFK